MVESAVHVEQVSLTAVDVLAELHQQIFSAEGQVWDSKSFVDLLSMPGARAWILSEDAGEYSGPCGLALARFAAGEGEIITIGVLPGVRRRGFARKMLSEIVKCANSQKADLFLEVAADNKAAHRLYMDHGFTETGTRKGYYLRRDGSKADALVLRHAFQQDQKSGT